MPMCTFNDAKTQKRKGPGPTSPTPPHPTPSPPTTPGLVLVRVHVCNTSHITRGVMKQSNDNVIQNYQFCKKSAIQNCMIQSNYNAMQHCQLCYKNTIQK